MAFFDAWLLGPLLCIGIIVASFSMASAEDNFLSADEIRERFVGNSLIIHHKGQVVASWYVAEDGTSIYDPLRGFQEPGYWAIDDEADKLCVWELDPQRPYCGRYFVEGGRYYSDWGDGANRNFHDLLMPGDQTDPTDNPGPNYEPHPDIVFPADLNIQPADPGIPEETAALSGAWFGTFSVWRDFVIVVERIEASHAEVVYAWGPHNFRPDNPGWSLHQAVVKDGGLDIKLSWGTIKGRLNQDSTLAVTFDWGESPEASHAIRWEDPSLAPQPPLEVVAPDPAETRDKLTFWGLQIGEGPGEDPLHNSYFAPLGQSGVALHVFEGRLTVESSKMLGRPAHSRGGRDEGPFPPFSVEFFTEGNRLVPSERGIIQTSRDGSRWNIILEPGRVWSEASDQGWSRAAFPFLLTDPRFGDGHNGIATFLFNDQEVSHLRFQVVKEASPGGHRDLWGQMALRYEPAALADKAALAAAFRREQAAKLPRKSWSDLAALYGAEVVESFDGTVIRKEISTSGLIVDGTLYATACRTRYGPYPFCEDMRHGVHSVTKSVVGLIALLRMAEVYGDAIFDLKVLDFVDIPADHDGWRDVSFDDAINMASGIGNIEPRRVKHYVERGGSQLAKRLYEATSMRDKLVVIGRYGNYPWGAGEVFRYGPHDPMVLSAAMDAFLKQKQGPEAQLWQWMNREVFQPLGIAYLPTLQSIENGGTPGIPINASGLFATLEDLAKISVLLQCGGQHNGQQLLHAEKLRETLQEGNEKGYPNGWFVDKEEGRYFRSFWFRNHASRAGCQAAIPAMSGVGGNYVLLMPNGLTAIRFAGGPDDDDNGNTYDTSHMRQVADAIRPLCQP